MQAELENIYNKLKSNEIIPSDTLTEINKRLAEIKDLINLQKMMLDNPNDYLSNDSNDSDDTASDINDQIKEIDTIYKTLEQNDGTDTDKLLETFLYLHDKIQKCKLNLKMIQSEKIQIEYAD